MLPDWTVGHPNSFENSDWLVRFKQGSYGGGQRKANGEYNAALRQACIMFRYADLRQERQAADPLFEGKDVFVLFQTAS